jgi:hypothetical protein
VGGGVGGSVGACFLVCGIATPKPCLGSGSGSELYNALGLAGL